jgi:hypothetical protein
MGGTGDTGVDATWDALLDRLELITARGFEQPFSAAAIKRWASRVARYSFTVLVEKSSNGVAEAV